MLIVEAQVDIMHCNIRGWISHNAELAAVVRRLDRKPLLACLNETFLDKAVQQISLEGYSLIGRRDRRDGRSGGGVVIFVKSEFVDSVTLVQDSEAAERLWCVVHSDHGPISVCCWYRPPEPGEVATIQSFKQE